MTTPLHTGNNTGLHSPRSRPLAAPRWLWSLTLAILALVPALSQAQTAATYGFTQSSGAYTPITGGTVAATATVGSQFSLDNSNYVLAAGTIPFTFTFGGTGYTGLTISSNGYVTFGATAPSTTNYTPIAVATGFSGAAAAFARDLVGDATAGSLGQIRYETVGTSPNRAFVVQFTNFKRYISGTQADNMNFQIRLNETSNVIDFVYGSFSLTSTAGTVQVGLRGASGVFNDRTTTTNWLTTNAGTTSGATMATSSTIKPTSGLTYTYTPPAACLPPTTVVASSITGTAASVSFAAPTPAPTDYIVSVSPAGGTVTPATPTASPVALSGLSASTTYTVTIRSNCAGTPSIPTTVTFTTVANCVAPTALATNTVTSTSANLTFTSAASGVTDYTVTTSPATTPQTVTGASSGSPVAFTGLSGNTTYTVTVVSNCTAGGTSAPVTTTFTTPTAPPAFTTSRATNISYNSIAATGTSFTFSAGTNSSLTNTDDNVSDAVTLPAGFNFSYLGSPVTGFRICTNGWMTVDPTVISAQYGNGLGVTPSNAGNFSGGSPGSTLAPFWEDLVCQGNPTTAAALASSMKYLITGPVGSRVLTVEWIGMEKFSYAGPNLNFQVKLYEGSNNIEYVYGNMTGFDGSGGTNSNAPLTYSVGLNGATGVATGNYLAQQVHNSNYFLNANAGTIDVGANALSVAPACYSMITLVPGTYATGLAPVAAAPANDEPAGAIGLGVGLAPPTDYCAVYSSANATASTSIPVCTAGAPGTPDDDVFFTFSVPATSNITVELAAAAGYNGVLQILSGTPGSFVSEACVNATSGGLRETYINATLAAGTYYIRVYDSGTGSGANGAFALNVYGTPAPPANDDCAGAISLTSTLSCSGLPSRTTIGATATSGVTACSATTPGTADDDVWFSFVATAAAHVVTVTGASGFDAVFQAFSGSCGTLASFGCLNSTSTGGVEGANLTGLTVGDTYFVRVYHAGTGAGSGSFTICLSTTCIAPTALSATNLTDTSASLTWTAGTGNTSFSVEYGPTGFTPGTGTVINPATSPQAISGLTATTAYQFYVTQTCAPGQTVTSGPTAFTTTASCAAATTVSSNTVTGTSANITFTAGAGNTTYTVTATPASGPVVTNTGAASPIALTGLVPATSYSVVVTGDCGPAAVSATYTFSTPIANDNPSTATALVMGASCTPTSGTNVGATTTTPNGYVNGSSPDCAAAASPKDVWYTFTTAASGSGSTGAIITVTGTAASQIRAFSAASAAGPFTQIGCSTNTSSGVAPALSLTGLTASTTYFVRIAGYFSSDAMGAFTICVTSPPTCAAATTVSSNTVTGTSANITFTAGVGNTTYTVTATPASGPVVTNTGAASPIALTGLVPATSYSVVVTGDCGPAAVSATYTFSTLAPPPANDNCAGAVLLTSAATCTATSGSTDGATQSLAPILCNGFTSTAPAADVWYKFTATGPTHTIAVTGTFDGVMEVFSGSCGATANIGCADATGNNETLTLTTLTAGTTYLIRYYPYLAAPTSKTFTICVTEPASLTVANGQNLTATGTYNNITVQSGGVLTLSGNTTANIAVAVQAGGTLITNCNQLDGAASFNVAAGAELQICAANGIRATATGGAIRNTGTRSFSNDASYVYNGTAAQTTGDGLPSTVRNLTVNNASGVTLTNAVNIRQLARLQSGNLATGGNAFTLLSGPGGTALVDNTGGVVTGTGTMQRAITGGAAIGYRHYSAPVSNTTVADLAAPGFAPELSQAAAYNSSATPGRVTPFPNIFAYDETRLTSTTNNLSAFDKGWVAPASTATAMTVNRGYTVNASNAALVDFVGTFNNSTQNSGSLSRGADAQAGWQLLGNPYPSPLDWSTVGVAQRPGMDAAMYVFQSTGQYVGNYRSYSNGIGVSPLIDAGQGYFTRVALPNSTGSVNLTNANRVTTFGVQPTFGRGTNDLRPQLHLALAGAAQGGDDTYVYFETGATTGVDAAYDATKLSNPTGWNLGSLAGSQELAINGLPTLAGSLDVIVPLSLRVPQAGSFSFEVADLANFGSATVYLRDRESGLQQQLTAGTRYAFTLASATTPSTRFALVFRPGSVTGTRGGLQAAQVTVYPNPAHHSFSLNIPVALTGKTISAGLYNSLGQLVQQRVLPVTATGVQAQFDVQGLATGVYLLRLDTGSDQLTKRIVVE